MTKTKNEDIRNDENEDVSKTYGNEERRFSEYLRSSFSSFRSGVCADRALDTHLDFQTGQHAPIHWDTHQHNYYPAIVYGRNG